MTPKQATTILLSLLVGGVLLSGVGLLWRDFRETVSPKPPPPEAVLLANALLSEITPANGWFPYPKVPVFGWENADSLDGWELSETIDAAAADESGRSPSPALRNTDNPVGSQGRRCLAVPVEFPNPMTISRSPPGFAGARFIACDVYVPPEAPGRIGCLFFLKNKDGIWHQARFPVRLPAGRWTTVTADLRGNSPDIEPLGHLGGWDENQATQVRTVGLTFYGDQPWSGSLGVDNFRAWLRPETVLRAQAGNLSPAELQQAQAHREAPLRILNLRTEPVAVETDDEEIARPRVGLYETLTLRFDLNRQFGNPFDPEEIDVQVAVRRPNGSTRRVVGFRYQEFERTRLFEGDKLDPLGAPEWRIRITPTELGRHAVDFRITAKSKTSGESIEEALNVPGPDFDCVSSAERGFVQVSAKNPRFFEFSDGTFFYPVGLNLHTPIDLRCWEQIFRRPQPPDRGSFFYEDIMPKMAAAGQTTAEVWMAAWSFGIEWTSRYRGYYGVGRYSLERAWLLDRVLEIAKRNGLRVHLVLDNHGKFSAWIDWEWENNPLYIKEPGGRAAIPKDFFEDPECRKSHQRRLRYIAARWGADPTILGWEMVSEFDLVGGARKGVGDRGFFRTAPAQNWVREMIAAHRREDAYQRPITNHYATGYAMVDMVLAREPGLFDYVVCNGYYEDRRNDFIGTALDTSRFFQQLRKPFWITEYGGDWSGSGPERLHSDLHSGLWATWMTDAAGAPLFWWYDFVDRQNLFGHYKAFAEYVKGEDLRDVETRTEFFALGVSEPFVLTHGGAPSPSLRAVAKRWAAGLYAWVYNYNPSRMMHEAPSEKNALTFPAVEATFANLTTGSYRVEFWDTRQGGVLQTQAAEVKQDGQLKLKFPPFIGDVALKVKRTFSADGKPAEPSTASGRRPNR
jgi:hypothetical protein